jgi:hypothetical protein
MRLEKVTLLIKSGKLMRLEKVTDKIWKTEAS